MLLAAAGVVSGILYATFALFPLASGPTLSVNITDSETSGTAIIAGETTRVSRLTVNGLAVPLSEQGAFSVERAFPLGYTVVVVRAEDRFGRRREEMLTLITKEHEERYGSKKEGSSEEGTAEDGDGTDQQDRLN